MRHHPVRGIGGQGGNTVLNATTLGKVGNALRELEGHTSWSGLKMTWSKCQTAWLRDVNGSRRR